MAFSIFHLIFSLCLVHFANGKTCPGFPGYCSESFPGQTCVVVCSRGRNNVPLCQEDGTWTDVPRCIEHEPGVDEQIPGICPGISGYCSEAYVGQRCVFKCKLGRDIDSVCTFDGTWSPYPKCIGDIRETQDGCNPCPGAFGGPRNRTLEAIQGLKENVDLRNMIFRDKRPSIPTFAGNQKLGPIARKDDGALFRADLTSERGKFVPSAFPSNDHSSRATPLFRENTASVASKFPSFQRKRQPSSEREEVPVFRPKSFRPEPPSTENPQLKPHSAGNSLFREQTLVQRNDPAPSTEHRETRFVVKNGKILPSVLHTETSPKNNFILNNDKIVPNVPRVALNAPTPSQPRFIVKNGRIQPAVPKNEASQNQQEKFIVASDGTIRISSPNPATLGFRPQNTLPSMFNKAPTLNGKKMSVENESGFFGPFQIFDPRAQQPRLKTPTPQVPRFVLPTTRATQPTRFPSNFGPFEVISF